VLNDERAVLQDDASPAAQWPDHDALDVLIAASQVRIVHLRLPRMTLSRVEAAARFALEDQIAAADQAAHVAVSTQATDGAVLAVICPRDLVTSLDRRHRELARLRRVVAEPELAAAAAEWRWCQADVPDGSFVRLPDGSSMALSDIGRSSTLPAELALAIARADAKPIVRVEWPASAALVARWQEEHGVSFVAVPPLRWQAAPIPQQAIDVMQGELAREARTSWTARAIFAPAIWILGIALLLHVLATLGDWAALRIERARANNEWQALATAADVPRDAMTSPESIRSALARRQDEVLHAHHRFSSRDALSLLSRATPAMNALPSGALKRAIYQSGYWTLELEGANADALASLQAALRAADLEAQVVPTSSGARVRFGTMS
jgi:hypothetical protein